MANLLEIIIDGIQNKKGRGITILNLEDIEAAPCSQFIICEANNPTQVGAIADSVTDNMLEYAGRKAEHTDGYRNREWLIIDYGDIMVHIFLKEIRTHYDLEGVWGDAKITDIPDLD